MKYDSKPFSDLFGDRAKLNEPLGRYTTFKIGGPADIFFDAKTTQELVDSITVARKSKIPLFILGGGTNILIGDKGIRGLVVKNSTNRVVTRGIKGEMVAGKSRSRVFVEADSGVLFNKLVRFTIDEGLEGIEMHLGLPGTVGGALYMNAKWTHPEGYVGDVVYQAEILTSTNEIKIVPKTYFHFGYDSSVIQKTNDIVTKVVFSFVRSEKERLWKIADESIGYRRQTQPQGVFSAGCTFRNISRTEAIEHTIPNQMTSAGFLIDHSGLKGLQVGNAQISPMHANFIINKGQAKASDVVQLINRAKEQVKKQFKIELEEEILRVGEF